MSSPPDDDGGIYALPDELPQHLKQLIEQVQPPPSRANEWLVQGQSALSSTRSGERFSFYLEKNRERLAARFYEVVRASRPLGVIVVNGPSFPGPTIVGHSPSKKRQHYRAWHGQSSSFADPSWEVLKESSVHPKPRPAQTKKVRIEIRVTPSWTRD